MKKFGYSKEITLSAAARPGSCPQTRPALKLTGVIAICAALLLLFAHRPALADVTFNDALDTQLDGVTLPSGEFEPCVRLVGGDPGARDGSGVPIGFGPELTAICSRISPQGSSGGVGAGAQASAGGGVTTSVPVIERRQRKLRDEEEDGANESGDAEISLGSGFSVFFSAEYADLGSKQTAFEDGYDSDRWGVTLGSDYLVSGSMIAGLALNFNRWDGDYDTGGGFDTDSYGVTAFASFLPLERFFVDVAVGYARSDISEDRRRFYSREIIPDVNDPNTIDTEVFGGRIDGDRDDKTFSANMRLGYDIPIRQFNLSPRFAVDMRFTDIDGYTEKGNTGLELKYESDSTTSFLTRLGLQASMATSTTFGVVMPQLSLDWIHEYANDQRSSSVQYVQDLRDDPTTFSFDGDKPDRDFYELSAGLSVVLPKGVQMFFNYRTIIDHKYIDSDTATIGARIEF